MKQTCILLFVGLCAFNAQAQTPDYKQKAQEILAKMTLEEKASLCSGQSFWETKAIDRVGIPSMFMTDGPHGVRMATGSDFTQSKPATCFPTASALAASWDPQLAETIGQALGEEAQALNVQILLGPGANMKRSPLGGRNFEYFSEDPILAGRMATGLIKGVQSKGVGASLKHFAANNQEFERYSNNSEIDLRTLNEIYFPAFEMAVREAQPWTVMCAYNKVNGFYASESPFLLTETLRKRWGFGGFVVSDWGAVVDRVAGVKAGLNLEMPASGGINDAKIVQAVKSGALAEADLNDMVLQYLQILLKAKALHQADAKFDANAHHALARKAAGESMVLLKNEGGILPVKPGAKNIAIIGAFAKTPRYQGAGSSQMNPTKLSNVYEEWTAQKVAGQNFAYAEGYDLEGNSTATQIAEAVGAAKKAQLAVIFTGLPNSYESEGFDRNNLDLPEAYNKLIEAVAAVQPNTVVVLMNGSAVAMPWAGKVKGILEAWLGGQGGGAALADVLSGKVNPSGKLSETFPVRLEDTPAFPDFPNRSGNARYNEGVFIGYRHYNTRKIKPLYAFGYGLSYTSFQFSNLKLSKTEALDNEVVEAQVDVRNTGKVAGAEVVQLYVHDAQNGIVRPELELKHFEKVFLEPGAQKTVKFSLSKRDFAYFDVNSNDWQIQEGLFEIRVGNSSDHLPLHVSLNLKSANPVKHQLTRFSLMKTLRDHPKGHAVYEQLMGNLVPPGLDEAAKQKQRKMMESFFNDMPVFKFINMSGGRFTEEMLQGVLQMANN